MNNPQPPINRYAALSSLEELQIEKLKLSAKIQRQEEQIKEQVDKFLDIFNWIGNLSLVAKQLVSAIPFFRGFRLIFKLVNLFWKK